MTELALKETNLQVVPPGSLLFVARSGILVRDLPTSVNSVPVVINQDIKALTPVAEIDPIFLQYQISFRMREILDSTVKTGTTVQSLDFQSLRATEVVIPPLSEQRSIVKRLTEAFSRLDSARDKSAAALALLDQYRIAILRRALLGRFEGSQEDSKECSWREVELRDIADIQGGIALGKKSRTVNLVSRPYLRVANVQRGRLNLKEIKSIWVTQVEAERYALKFGDILMNEGGDRDKLGRGWVWQGEIEGCLHQNHVFRVRLHDPAFPPEFISHYANEIGQGYFLQQGKQTTNLASISKTRIRRLPLRIPSAEEAKRTLRLYQQRVGGTAEIERQLVTISAFVDAARRSVLSRALEGRLVALLPDGGPPDLRPKQRSDEVNAAPKVRRSHPRKGMTMRALNDALIDWPAEGLTFESIRMRLPSDYEVLKDALFELLAGSEPQLEQRYDRTPKAMRFFRRGR